MEEIIQNLKTPAWWFTNVVIQVLIAYGIPYMIGIIKKKKVNLEPKALRTVVQGKEMSNNQFLTAQAEGNSVIEFRLTASASYRKLFSFKDIMHFKFFCSFIGIFSGLIFGLVCSGMESDGFNFDHRVVLGGTFGAIGGAIGWPKDRGNKLLINRALFFLIFGLTGGGLGIIFSFNLFGTNPLTTFVVTSLCVSLIMTILELFFNGMDKLSSIIETFIFSIAGAAVGGFVGTVASVFFIMALAAVLEIGSFISGSSLIQYPLGVMWQITFLGSTLGLIAGSVMVVNWQKSD